MIQPYFYVRSVRGGQELPDLSQHTLLQALAGSTAQGVKRQQLAKCAAQASFLQR